jgi:acetyltransferase
VLAACGIPVVPTRTCAADPDAAAAARRDRLPGGAEDPVAADHAQERRRRRRARPARRRRGARRGRGDARARARAQPGATLAGFTVQAMVRRARAQELIVGASVDAAVRPGDAVRPGRHRGRGGGRPRARAAAAEPPAGARAGRAHARGTAAARLARRAGGRHGRAAGRADRGLAAAGRPARAGRARHQPAAGRRRRRDRARRPLRVDARRPGGAERFAIRPYPRELEERLDWQGRTVTLRPIRPEDEAQHLAFLERLDPEDIRMRVFYSRRRSSAASWRG